MSGEPKGRKRRSRPLSGYLSPRSLFVAALAVVAMVIVVAGCGGGSSSSSNSSTTTEEAKKPEEKAPGSSEEPTSTEESTSYTYPTAFTNEELEEPSGKNWVDHGGNNFNQRYSSLNEITTENVKELDIAWHNHLGEKAGIEQNSGGIEYGGVYYIASGNDDIYAFDSSTGKRLWKYHGASKATETGHLYGFAMGDGKVFYNQYNNYIVAIDAKTGKKVWAHGPVGNPLEGEYNSGAITYSNGMLFSGTGGSDSGVRGFIAAYDADTGKQVWKKYMVPIKKGEPGYSSWGGAETVHGGGGDWGHIVADPELGLVYAATANAEPYANRPKGDDLFTSSDVALDMKTGKMVWHYQFVHHDTWDDDTSANSPVLYNFELGGEMVHAIDQPTKMGMNFILNRETGEPFPQLPITEKKVPTSKEAPTNSKTQPYPKGEPYGEECATAKRWIAAGGNKHLRGPDGKDLQFGCIYTPIVSSHYTVPGWHDVADWPPNSFSQETGLMYVCSTNDRGDAYKAVSVKKAEKGPEETGYGTENESEVAGDWLKEKEGVITAIDPKTNDIAWKTVLPDGNGCYSGLATSAGGVLFVGTLDGHELGYDASNGKLLWESPHLDASPLAPPIIYEGLDGYEHVTVLVGGGGISADTHLGDSVYSFALPAAGQHAEEQAPKAPPSTKKSAGPETEKVSGSEVFESAGCGNCHTLAAAGSTGTQGPDLDQIEPSQATVEKQVTKGGGLMPAFGNKLSKKEIEEVGAYVAESTHK
jgi:PQQ-dependent dehydrogenase (methanol/ethanol family)